MRFLKTACSVALCTVLTAGMSFAQQGRDDHRNDRNSQNDRNDRNDHPDYHFRGQQDRDQLQRHYQYDVRRWNNNNNRHHYSAGQHLSRTDVSRFRPVPSSYYRGLQPLPRGYRYGYYQGNVVAYNPVTLLVADVLDLISH